MKKNYRKGIMKIDNSEDEMTKYNRECFEEINRLPFFEADNEGADNLFSAENDGVEDSGTDN